MTSWLTHLLNKAKATFGNYQNDSGQIPVSKGNPSVKFYQKEKDMDMGVSIQPNNEETQVHGSKRVPNSANRGQNLENLAFKHFSSLNNTEGCVTKALNNYAKEVYSKPLKDLNEEQYRAVCNVCRRYATSGGTTSPASQLYEHDMEIIKKFGKQ